MRTPLYVRTSAGQPSTLANPGQVCTRATVATSLLVWRRYQHKSWDTDFPRAHVATGLHSMTAMPRDDGDSSSAQEEGPAATHATLWKKGAETQLHPSSGGTALLVETRPLRIRLLALLLVAGLWRLLPRARTASSMFIYHRVRTCHRPA